MDIHWLRWSLKKALKEKEMEKRTKRLKRPLVACLDPEEESIFSVFFPSVGESVSVVSCRSTGFEPSELDVKNAPLSY